MKENKISVKSIATVGVLGAVATILMYLEFPLTFLIPSFVKFDFSDLPALLASFALGPIAGIAVCFIKCVIHIAVSSSAGVGELANFILGCCFVLPAGIIYKRIKTKKSALIGSLAGALIKGAGRLRIIAGSQSPRKLLYNISVLYAGIRAFGGDDNFNVSCNSSVD